MPEITHDCRYKKRKVTNKIFVALCVVVVICGILNIWNDIFGNFELQIFALAYLQEPAVPVVAIALIAIGLDMVVKGSEDAINDKSK